MSTDFAALSWPDSTTEMRSFSRAAVQPIVVGAWTFSLFFCQNRTPPAPSARTTRMSQITAAPRTRGRAVRGVTSRCRLGDFTGLAPGWGSILSSSDFRVGRDRIEFDAPLLDEVEEPEVAP